MRKLSVFMTKENQRDILWEGDRSIGNVTLSGLFPNVGKNLSKYRTDWRNPVSDKVSMDLQEIRCLYASNHQKDNASFMILSNEEDEKKSIRMIF